MTTIKYINKMKFSESSVKLVKKLNHLLLLGNLIALFKSLEKNKWSFLYLKVPCSF